MKWTIYMNQRWKIKIFQYFISLHYISYSFVIQDVKANETLLLIRCTLQRADEPTADSLWFHTLTWTFSPNGKELRHPRRCYLYGCFYQMWIQLGSTRSQAYLLVSLAVFNWTTWTNKHGRLEMIIVFFFPKEALIVGNNLKIPNHLIHCIVMSDVITCWTVSLRTLLSYQPLKVSSAQFDTKEKK